MPWACIRTGAVGSASKARTSRAAVRNLACSHSHMGASADHAALGTSVLPTQVDAGSQDIDASSQDHPSNQGIWSGLLRQQSERLTYCYARYGLSGVVESLL